MKNIEYTKMAHLYDQLYINKNYQKEVDFITSFIKKSDCKILDAGCGTGNHAKILHELGYTVTGFDQSKEMIEIANTKINNAFHVDNLLTFESNDKYDVIISFFAVFNHLKNYNQVKRALLNLKNALAKEGIIIIDLHNPQKNGTKIDCVNNISRTMKWQISHLLQKEYSKITYSFNNAIYKTKHVFKIFNIKKLTKLATKLGFKSICFYENYNTKLPATRLSKNIQMVLKTCEHFV